MTDDDWDTAARWKKFADPYNENRSCSNFKIPNSTLDYILNISKIIQSDQFQWNDKIKKKYLTLHAFHSTGIEGNTLTLPETYFVIDGQSLFRFINDEQRTSPETSVNEVKNLKYAIDHLKLSYIPVEPISNITKQLLIDINSMIVKDMGISMNLRRKPVAIGHQKVLLPMPDELPALVEDFVKIIQNSILELSKIHDLREKIQNH